MKLSPQIYTKLDKFEENGGTPTKTESGLIAQEIYYNAPELRHLVSMSNYGNGKKRTPIEYDLSNNKIVENSISPALITTGYDASGNPIREYETIEYNNTGGEYDIQTDPDYSALGWGHKSATVNYIGLIPYLIKANQEKQAILDEQEAIIAQQTTQVEELKTRLSSLESK